MQYILTGKKTSIRLVFRYNSKGFITSFETENVIDAKQLEYLFWNANFPFPYTEDMIDPIVKLAFFGVKKVEDDLSFGRFWHVYDYKVSKKKAEKLWQKMSKANKIKVFLHLPRYRAYLDHRRVEKAYPDTYLRNEKYEDEY